MLTPLPKLDIDLVSFPPKISKNRGISVNSLVCPRYALLFRLGIVKRTDVDIQGRQLALAGGYRANLGGRIANQSRRLFLDDPIKCPVHHIQPLPEGRTGGTLTKTQAVTEKRNLPKRLDRIVVRLPHTQQPNHRFHNISVGNLGIPASGQHHGIESRPKFRPVQQRPDQGQSRMARQMLVTLFDDKFHRLHLHLPGVISWVRTIINIK